MIHCSYMQVSTYPASPMVKGALVLGVISIAMMSIVSWKLNSSRQDEILRYQACSQGSRRDCDASLFWVLAGLAKPNGLGDLNTKLPVTAQEGKRVVRSSEKAPLLTSLRPQGLTPQGVGYAVQASSTVDLITTIENADRVEARYHPNGSTDDVLLEAMKPVSGKDNTFEAKFVWTQARPGELEIRAYGQTDTDRTSLIVPVSIESVAKSL